MHTLVFINNPLACVAWHGVRISSQCCLPVRSPHRRPGFGILGSGTPSGILCSVSPSVPIFFSGAEDTNCKKAFLQIAGRAHVPGQESLCCCCRGSGASSAGGGAGCVVCPFSVWLGVGGRGGLRQLPGPTPGPASTAGWVEDGLGCRAPRTELKCRAQCPCSLRSSRSEWRNLGWLSAAIRGGQMGGAAPRDVLIRDGSLAAG